jgi:cysteine dioxygenase
MKVLKGSLQETLYSLPPSSSVSAAQTAPTITKKSVYEENEVTYISDKIGLHKISNTSDTNVAVSLHLYTPPHAANFGFNLFDEKTGRATHIKQAGFFSKRGEKLERVGLGNF